MLAVPTEQQAPIPAAAAEQQAEKREPGNERHFDQARPALQEFGTTDRQEQADQKSQLTQTPKQKTYGLRAGQMQLRIEEHRCQHEPMPQKQNHSQMPTSVAPALRPAPPRPRA